jgi:hypothetical protein
LVVAWNRVIFGFLGVVDQGSIRGWIMFDLVGVVLGGFAASV